MTRREYPVRLTGRYEPSRRRVTNGMGTHKGNKSARNLSAASVRSESFWKRAIHSTWFSSSCRSCSRMTVRKSRFWKQHTARQFGANRSGTEASETYLVQAGRGLGIGVDRLVEAGDYAEQLGVGGRPDVQLSPVICQQPTGNDEWGEGLPASSSSRTCTSRSSAGRCCVEAVSPNISFHASGGHTH